MPQLLHAPLLISVIIASKATNPALGFSGTGWGGSAVASTGGIPRLVPSTSSLFDASPCGASGEADRPSQATAELLVSDEARRARKIADSVGGAKVAAVETSNEAPKSEVEAKVGVGTTLVKDRTREEVDELKFKIGKVDKDRVKELEAKEAQIYRLNFRIAELREKAADSERRAKEAERKIETLLREGEGAMEENKNLVAKIRSQFRKEKDDLSEQLRGITDELREARLESSREVTDLKLAAKESEGQLRSEIDALKSSLKDTEGFLSTAVEEAKATRERHRDELTKQRDEAKRLQDASDRVAGQEKRELRNKTWELQTALDAAKFEIMQTRKEADGLETARGALEERMKEMERSFERQVFDMEEEIKSVRFEMASRIADLKAMAEKQKVAMRKEKIEAIAKGKTEQWEALDLAKAKYDDMVIMNEQKLKAAEEDAKRRVQTVQEEMDARLEDVKNASEREKLALKEQNIAEVLFVRAEAEKKIEAVKKTLAEVEDDVARKEVIIDVYEKERKSLRKLARLSWKLARERSSKLRQRVAGKLLRRRGNS